MDEVLSVNDNLERNKKLKAEILNHNHTAWEIMAMSQDKKHQEGSFLTDAPRQLSIALAIEYNQRAIFQVNNDNLVIISCSSPNEVFAVDRFSKRSPKPQRISLMATPQPKRKRRQEHINYHSRQSS